MFHFCALANNSFKIGKACSCQGIVWRMTRNNRDNLKPREYFELAQFTGAFWFLPATKTLDKLPVSSTNDMWELWELEHKNRLVFLFFATLKCWRKEEYLFAYSVSVVPHNTVQKICKISCDSDECLETLQCAVALIPVSLPKGFQAEFQRLQHLGKVVYKGTVSWKSRGTWKCAKRIGKVTFPKKCNGEHCLHLWPEQKQQPSEDLWRSLRVQWMWRWISVQRGVRIQQEKEHYLTVEVLLPILTSVSAPSMYPM